MKGTMSNEELQRVVGNAAAVTKLVTGVGNNAAWLVMMDGYDAAKHCRGFRRSVKGGHSVGWYFKRVINLFHDYERNLLRTQTNRMFHLADMSENNRRKYGNISDDEYYEFWKGVGGVAYAKTKPMITSLWNKYRLSLQQHGIKDAEHIGWVMTAQAALDLAGAMYESVMKEYEASYKLPRRVLNYVFSQFSLHEVSKAWMQALLLLAPETEPLKLNDVEEKNIDIGLQQLMEAWMEPELLYSSASGAVEDYEEIFATKGFKKKVLREIAEVKAETLAELEKQ
jgi:hypothetical protein